MAISLQSYGLKQTEELYPFENNTSQSISNADHGQEKAHYFKRH